MSCTHLLTSGYESHLHFTGKERDFESGLDNFGARYYSNRFGRWLSADWSSVPVPVPYANLTNPQSLNLYSMVSDDPETFADLDGHDPGCNTGGYHTDSGNPLNCEGQVANDKKQAADANNQNAAQRTCNGDTCTFTKTYNETEFRGGDVITTTATVTNTATYNSDGIITSSRTDVQGTTTVSHADGNGNFTTTQTTWARQFGSNTPSHETLLTTKQLSYGEAVKVHGARAMSAAQDNGRTGVAGHFIGNTLMGIAHPSARNVGHVAAGTLMGLCFVGEPCGAVEAVLSLVVGGAAYAESRDKH